jgi:hypothetical protein
MNSLRQLPVSRLRLSVGAKFLLAVGVLVLAVAGVAGVGAIGLARMNVQIQRLQSDGVATTQHVAALRAALHDVDKSGLRRNSALNPDQLVELNAELDQDLIPHVRQEISAVRSLNSGEAHMVQDLGQLEAGLAEFLQLRRAGADPVADTNAGTVPVDPAAATRTAALLERMTALTDEIQAEETREVAVVEREAASSYLSTRLLLAGSVAGSLLGGLAVVLLLIRNLVPRIRDYSHFATEVASGRAVGRLQPRGGDELAELGQALNDLVAKSELLNLHEEAQAEYVNTLQVTGTEEEAHELVQRHIERSLPDSAAVVLTRNNSANRLQPATALAPDSDVALRLLGAEPRACLALGFARTHREGSARPPLLSCALCTDRDAPSSQQTMTSPPATRSTLASAGGPHPRPVPASLPTVVPTVLTGFRARAISRRRGSATEMTRDPVPRGPTSTTQPR